MQPSYTSPTAIPPPPRRTLVRHGGSRPGHVAIFCGCVLWYGIARALATSAASGFALRFDIADEQPLVDALGLLFLVVLGLSALRSREQRVVPLRSSLGLPSRATAGDEWATGAALGWAIAAASVFVMVLGRAVHMQVWIAPRAFWLFALGASALLLGTLAKVLALYGYGFQHLIEGIGPARATAVVIAIAAGDAWLTRTVSGRLNGSLVTVSMVGALVLCLCWLRTHAVWLGWGAWFAWAASTALVFGLPVGLSSPYSAVVDARAIGSAWLTGGDYGPAAAGLTALMLIAAIPLLIRVTDEYAWKYTRMPIVAAGVPVDIPAPAAHAEMEEPTPVAPSLVQIQPIAPASGPATWRRTEQDSAEPGT